MVKVTALGGVGEYGRNCFLLKEEATNQTILLDCGVKNGKPEQFPAITEQLASTIDVVFLSHVHNDHVGALPLLAAKGFTKEIWLSEASLAQIEPIKSVWRKKADVSPYSSSDVDKLRFQSFPSNSRGKWTKLSDHLSFTWGYSGHMLGSVWYVLQVGKHMIFFSGDMSLESPLLVTDYPRKMGYDVALLDTGHSGITMPREKSMEAILAFVHDPARRYTIPVSISGKAFDLMYLLYTNLPDRIFFIEASFEKSAHLYLQFGDNINSAQQAAFKKMLQSERVQFGFEPADQRPGIYISEQPVVGCVPISTSDLAAQSFYKSHPDLADTNHLLKFVKAKQYLFFHSRQKDLRHLLSQIPHYQSKHIGGV